LHVKPPQEGAGDKRPNKEKSEMLLKRLPASLALAMTLLASTATATQPAARHSVDLDGYSFKIDGNRVYIWSGEFHPYRLPSPDLWRDIFQKMKAAGFNTTSIYFSWGYHSPAPGVYDFSGVRDMDRLLDIAREVGIYVIARPGPYINAELDGGGFPTWLSTKAIKNRSPEAGYVRYGDEWLTQIDAILARHQWTNGTGTVIAYQVENEYFHHDTPEGREYMAHLEEKARKDGITVPLVGNHSTQFISGKGALAVDGEDYYPQGFNCSNPAKWNGVPDMSKKRVKGMPLFTPEFQGGAFDPWGGPGYAKCAELINDKFADVFYKQNIAAGATAQNFYMLFGGTSWGWQPIPQNYTSYDYGAAIQETRQFDAKFYEDKLIGYFTQAVAPLAKTESLAASKPDNAAIVDIARVNPDTGTQFHYLRHEDSTSNAVDATHISLKVGGRSYARVPQAPDTAITLNGRQAKIILANYDLGAGTLVYSTSELMTNAAIGQREIAVMYGDHGQPGETVLRFAHRPAVKVLAGKVEQQWQNGELRLNYLHDGLARVLVSAGQGKRPLLLLIGDRAEAARFWQLQSAAGPVLVRGTHLVRSAAVQAHALALTGDAATENEMEVFGPGKAVSWNGRALALHATASGSLAGTVPTASAVSLPELTSWRMHAGAPEVAPDFDDSTWQVADHTKSASITPPGSLPVLFADDYNFHIGNTWYRGHFKVANKEQAPAGISLQALSGGNAGAFSVWLNGSFLGSIQGKELKRDFAFPKELVKQGDNVVSVLTVNMGHEQDWSVKNENRTARGLVSAKLTGANPVAISWRLQGKRGGEQLVDPVRGVFNNGGLYGERAGWFLPGFPDGDWKPVALPASVPGAGVTWYRTEFRLALPAGQDTSVGLNISDQPVRHYRATIFVNGWMMGNYVNDVGPQHSFPIPNGILQPNGNNTVAIAVWNTDASSGGLGKVSLVNYGSVASALRVQPVASPAYDAKQYAKPN
jgi:beta-galactosidase